MKFLLLFIALVCAPLFAQAATILTIGSGSAVTTIDRSATFDVAITSDGSPGLTGVSSDYSEGGIRISNPMDPSASYNELFYFTSAFGGNETGGFYYPNGGSVDPINISNGFGMQAVEFLFGSGERPLTGFAELSWRTTGGPGPSSSGSAILALGTVVGFYNPLGFVSLEIGINGRHALAVDDLIIQDTETNIVPLPASLPLTLMGVCALGICRKRRLQHKSSLG